MNLTNEDEEEIIRLLRRRGSGWTQESEVRSVPTIVPGPDTLTQDQARSSSESSGFAPFLHVADHCTSADAIACFKNVAIGTWLRHYWLTLKTTQANNVNPLKWTPSS